MTSFKLTVNIPREILNKVCNTTIAVFTILAILFISSCKDDPVPTSEENPNLVGIWKLKYFIEVESNTKREPDISKWIAYLDSIGKSRDSVEVMENLFTLIFYNRLANPILGCNIHGIPNENVKFIGGNTGANDMYGHYSVDYNTNTLTACINITMVGNPFIPDHYLYDKVFRGMNKSFSFKLFTDVLLLYYDDGKKYLEFIKIGDINE